MPDGTEVDFDAELNAIINGTGADTATPEPEVTQTQPTEAAKLKFGGREWDSPEKLGKAYEALHKDYTRKSQEHAKLKQYGDFDAYLNKHPELRNEFSKLWQERVNEYNKRISAGQSPATAEKATGVPQEYAERLERIEAHFEDVQIEKEKSALESKFNLDKEDMRLVIHKAIELEERGVRNLSLEDVYKMMSFESQKLAARKEGQKEAQDRLTGKKKAAVGGSDSPTATPNAKGVNDMNDNEFTRALSDKLSGLGYSG